MIVVTLKGGLGNQLFQYATGRSLSHRLGVNLVLDLSYYRESAEVEGITHRSMKLDAFRISDRVIITDYKLKHQSRSKLVQKLLSYLGKNINIVKEKSLAFEPHVLSLGDNNWLVGYWQNEVYFSQIRNTLLDELTLVEPFTSEANKLLVLAQSSPYSVSLHVRRGDYASREDYLKIFGLMGHDYYNKAISKISQVSNNLSFLIFSDDIDWCKGNLDIPFDHVWVELNNEVEELMIMANCKHNIIANSSFSWWGAWLNNNPSKVVIAPRKWFADPDWNSQVEGLVPASWIRI